MARPPKESKEQPQGVYIGKGKTLQLYAGADLIASKQSISHRDADIDVYSFGCVVDSKKTRRTLLIYSANIKIVELMPEAPAKTA